MVQEGFVQVQREKVVLEAATVKVVAMEAHMAAGDEAHLEAELQTVRVEQFALFGLETHVHSLQHV